MLHRLIAIGSCLAGITACITMAAPPLLSVLWFPTSERTTATALSAMAGYLGTGVAFITGDSGLSFFFYKTDIISLLTVSIVMVAVV